MTTDITALLTSSLQSSAKDKLSFKTEFKTSESSAFDSLLSNASKNYASKDNNIKENFASKDYAQKTKDASDVKDTKNYHKNEEKNSVTESDNKENSSEIKDKDTNSKTENKTEDKIETEKTDKTDNADKTDKKDIENENKKPNTENNKESAENPKDKTETTETKDNETAKIGEAVSAKDIAMKVIANEQIIANIEYPQNVNQTEVSPEVSSGNETKNKTSVQLVSNAVNTDTNIKAAIINTSSNVELNQTVSQISTEQLPNTAENLKTSANNTQNQENTAVNITAQAEVADNIDVEIKTETLPKESLDKTVATVQKTAQENLASDTARLTVNIEGLNQESLQTEDSQAVTVTPLDTEKLKNTKEPMIKVTEEVASQQPTKSTNSFIENKDLTTNVKNNAVEKMTTLQNTDTTVTESRTQSNTSQQNNSSLTQGNAQEQVAKLAIDNAATVNTDNVSSTDAFINKLNASLDISKSGKTQNSGLNQNSIMNQLNAKFNEMQQAGQNKVSMVLQPESLGKVSVEIINSKDGIVAKMTTDNQQVKELFDKSVESLKSNLSSQGINVNNIKVECTQESSNNAMGFEREQFNQSNFNNAQGQNHQTQNHNGTNQEVYNNGYSTDENTEDLNGQVEIKNTETIIKHNGKVDYKV